MKYLNSINFKEMPIQMMNSFFIAKETIPFIKQHRLWEGFFKHKWIIVLMILVSVVFSYSVWIDLMHLFGIEKAPIPEVMTSSLNVDVESITDAVQSEKRGAVSGGTKYLLIIFLEVIIFYFSAKTVNVVSERDVMPTFREFINAEKRMIKIMILNFVKGLIAHAIIYTVLSIAGKAGWTSFIMFFVYSYFIGYAFLDNYNELYVRTIQNSDRIIRYHAGAAISLGILVSLLLYVPVLGPLFAPILGGIAGAIYGNRYQIQELFRPEEPLEVEEEYI